MDTEIQFDGATALLHCRGCRSDTADAPLMRINLALMEAGKRLSDGMPKWIACAEQLPKRRYVEEPGFPGISINCLVVDADGDFDVAAYDLEDANWYSLQRATFLSGITHWMPLPEAPK